jgi:hypothetical protein
VAGAVIELFPQNPPKVQLPPLGVFTTLHIERAPDAGGAPGAFAEIGTAPIDTSDEFTYYQDIAGDDTAWYRHRFSNGAATFSGRSPAIQAGDSVVRQDVRAEIPDLDITAAMWDRWGRYVLSDLYMLGIWKEDEGEIVITTTNNVPTERYTVPGYIRDVYRVELRDQNGSVLEQLSDPEEVAFSAGNRQLRIFDASLPATNVHYWAIGKAQYRTLGELTDDFYVLALHMLLVRYAQYRKRQRLNWKKFITFDPTTDILPKDIDMFIAEEKSEVAVRAAALANPEPPIPIPN